MRLNSLLLALALAAPVMAAPSETRIPEAALATAAQLRERALADPTAWRVVESLTTEVGPRLAGSEADARAVAWAQAKFEALGFDRVWLEPVTFPKWERRSESAPVLGANAQPLGVTALGGSPAGEVAAEVVRFPNLAALEAAAAGSLAGRIAFIDYRMKVARDGSDYRIGGAIRSRGPSAAIRAGAGAFLMRSAGTGSHRVAHTGMTRFDEGLKPIPSASLTTPDADQLSRLLARGPVRVRIALDCGWDGQATSHNVIGEITGRQLPDEVVLIGITMAAGHLIGKLARAPRRSIRVVAFANEEQGLYGGKAYAAKYADALRKHQLGAESDFGAGRIYAFDTGAPAHARAAVRQIATALAPLGIEYAPGKGAAGPDIGPSAALGLTWAWLGQDGTDYFDLHHNADDTLDKIDPQALAQNAAAYAVLAYLAAEAEGDFGSAPRSDAGGR